MKIYSPHLFLELKGIEINFGEVKIDLNLDAQLVKHRPYRLNLQVKEKVKK